MPIVFEQPGAIAPDVSVGAGQAEQYSRDLPSRIQQQRTLAGIYENAARVAASHRGGGGPGAGAPPPMQFTVGTGAGGYTPQAPNPQQQPPPIPFGQPDQLRLQRLQQARSQIEEGVQNGNYSKEEGNEMMNQVMGGASVLEARRQQTQLQQQQQQLQQGRMQTEEMARRQQELERFHAQGAVAVTFNLPGREGLYQRNHLGLIVPVEDQRQGAAQRTQVTAQHVSGILRQVDSQMSQEEQRSPTPPAWAANAQAREQERQRRINRDLQLLQRQGGQGGQGGGLDQPTQQQVAAQQQLSRLFERPGAAPSDPGLVQPSDRRVSTDPDLRPFVGSPGAVPLRDYLNTQAQPESPNDPSGVTREQVSRAAEAAANAYNATGRFDRTYGPQTRRLGLMADLLLNAHNRQRGLTRHELQAYQRLHQQIPDFDQAVRDSLAISPPGS